MKWVGSTGYKRAYCWDTEKCLKYFLCSSVTRLYTRTVQCTTRAYCSLDAQTWHSRLYRSRFFLGNTSSYLRHINTDYLSSTSDSLHLAFLDLSQELVGAMVLEKFGLHFRKSKKPKRTNTGDDKPLPALPVTDQAPDKICIPIEPKYLQSQAPQPQTVDNPPTCQSKTQRSQKKQFRRKAKLTMFHLQYLSRLASLIQPNLPAGRSTTCGMWLTII